MVAVELLTRGNRCGIPPPRCRRLRAFTVPFGRALEELVELLAGMARGYPIADVAAAWTCGPTLRQVEDADFSSDPGAGLRGRLRVSAAGVVIVPHDNQVGAPEHLRILGAPFGPFAGLGGAIGTARCRNADLPEIVGVLLALNAYDRVAGGDCLIHLR